jgi:hypothetical protein
MKVSAVMPPAEKIASNCAATLAIDLLLPSHDVILEPNTPVRADVCRSRKPAAFFHPPKRRVADRDNPKHLFFVEHAAGGFWCVSHDGSLMQIELLSDRAGRRLRAGDSPLNGGAARRARPRGITDPAVAGGSVPRSSLSIA